MKLELLLGREPFEDILVETLREVLHSEFGWTGSISWNSGRPPFPCHALLVNGKLNVIYPVSLPRTELRPITREYSYHETPWRHFLQRNYVRFATSFPFEWFTTCAVITIDPWPTGVENWCIIPGNHSVRVVDFRRNTCLVFAKAGFNREFMQAEVSLRRTHRWLPAPELQHIDQRSGSYRETQISGLPLGRIPDLEKRGAILKQAQNVMRRLYDETREDCAIDEWLAGLCGKVKIATVGLPEVYHDSTLRKIEELNVALAAIAGGGGGRVSTVITHGDFQGANIYAVGELENARLCLIDWEYTARRFHLYDALVFSARSRFPAGLALRLKMLKSAGRGGLPEWGWCRSETDKSGRLLDWMIACFLIEDLLVRLRDQALPGLKSEGEGLVRFVSEAAEFVVQAGGGS